MSLRDSGEFRFRQNEKRHLSPLALLVAEFSAALELYPF
jgi:hypothetical protein